MMKKNNQSRIAVRCGLPVFLLSFLLHCWSGPSASAQQIDWMVYDTTFYTFNPTFSVLPVATGNSDELICSWLEQFQLSYDQSIYGNYALRSFDATGVPGYRNTIGPKATVRSIRVRGNGDVIVCGSFMDTLDVNGVTLFPVNQPGQFARNSFLICFSSTGNLLWSRNVSSTQPSLEVIDADAIDQNGNYWFANMGFTGGIAAAFCLDAAGQDSVSFPLPAGGILLSDMQFDASGSCYLSGGVGSGNYMFGGLPVNLNTTYNRFLLKMDQNGQGKWFFRSDDITIRQHYIAVDDSAFIYFTGELNDSMTFGGYYMDGPNWVNDYFTAKFDSSGNVLWAHDVPNGPTVTGDLNQALGSPMCADSNGFYQLTSYRGLVDFGNGITVGGLPLASNYGLSLIRYDSDGNVQWADDIPTTYGLYGFSVVSNSTGVYIAGTSSGSQQIGSDSIIVPTNYTFSSWAARFNASTPTGVPAVSPLPAASIFPNPSSDAKLYTHLFPAGGPVQVLDIHGKVVFRFRGTSYAGVVDTGLPNGLYFVVGPEGKTQRWSVVR